MVGAQGPPRPPVRVKAQRRFSGLTTRLAERDAVPPLERARAQSVRLKPDTTETRVLENRTRLAPTSQFTNGRVQNVQRVVFLKSASLSPNTTLGRTSKIGPIFGSSVKDLYLRA